MFTQLRNGTQRTLEFIHKWWLRHLFLSSCIICSCFRTDQWYRLCHPRFHVSHPDAPGTLRKVRQIHDKTIDLDQWEKVPYPSPLPNYFDFVYSIDQDAGVLALSKWSRVDDTKAPLTLEADLEDVCDDPQVIINLWKSTPEVLSPRIRIVESQDEQCVSSEYPHSVKPLHIGPRFPTALMELQQHFFLDFVFLWRWWIDDPYTWHYGSHVFNAFISAILRIASWDLEVSKNPDVPLPVSHSSIPRWHFSTEEIYWFHGFLVILHPHLNTTQRLQTALARVKEFIHRSGYTNQNTKSILISPRQIAFAELSDHTTSCSEVLPLLADSSASRCFAGFRILAQVLSSSCWKSPHRETWGFPLPPEILSQILRHSEPRDTLLLAQASFLAESCYYTSVPQMGDVSLPRMELSIPCCGDRTGLEKSGLRCRGCFLWYHRNCIGLDTLPADGSYTCDACSTEDPKSRILRAGGIHTLHGRTSSGACFINIDGSVRILRVRTSKPAHLRPELRLIGDLIGKVPKNLVDITIRFNGDFSGLAYGLDNIEPEKDFCEYKR